MNLSDVALLRLANQQIGGGRFKTPGELVRWMGAMQAQDYPMAKWAIGVRLPGSTEKLIEESIERGEIIRTHVLRPTWHFVAAEDVSWMLKLTAPRIKAQMRSRDRTMGLTETHFERSNRAIQRALEESGSLTRDEMTAVLRKAAVPTDMNRAWHLVLRMELDGIICSGPTKRGKYTYAFLSERVPRRRDLSKEESLATLANRYIASHGPATVEDFSWWSGLTMAEAKHAFSLARSGMTSETIGAKTFWFSDSLLRRRPIKRSAYLLPAYDEFIISYKDRSASVSMEHQSLSVSSNGIFRPAIAVDGRVSGLWKKTGTRGEVVVEHNLFRSHTKSEMKLMRASAASFGRFLGTTVRIEAAGSGVRKTRGKRKEPR